MAFGRLKVDQIETSTQIVNVDDLTASNGVSDGNKGDITVASGGTVWLVNNGAVSYNELADLPSFTGPVVAGRESGTGALQGLSLGNGLSISGGTLSVTVSGGGTGSVTSVGLIAPSGFAVAGSPITSSGNITLSFAAGYSLPTTASQANWDTAHSERLYWDGGATGLNAVTARTSLGLGNSATLNVGTTAGTVAAGDALGVHVAAADPHPNYALESSLAAVATTGAYSDLTGTPVIPSGADATPQPLGVAAIGISTDYAREDHIHAMPSAADVGADPAGTAASGISTHEAAADPHPNYALESSLGGAALLNVGTTSGTVAAGDDNRFVPSGGTTGQVLTKTSGTDYDASWSDLPATDLSYDPATRQLASSTGTDATLPLFSNTEAGLTPQSGGGTTNFLRADGTWAAPPGGGGVVYYNRRPALHRGPLFYKTASETISIVAGAVLNGQVYSSATAVTMPGSFTNNTDYAIWQHPSDGALVADASFTTAPTGAAGGSIVGGFHYIPSGRPTAFNNGSPTTAAEILEYSIWDLTYRPSCPDPRGMACIESGFWIDLYLTGATSYAGSTFSAVPSSKIGLTVADGSSPPLVPARFGGNGSTNYGSFTWYEASEMARSFGKALPTYDQFSAAAYGAPEAGSRGSDPGTVQWERVSLFGLAQATGTLWQWAQETCTAESPTGWQTGVTEGRGDVYGSPTRALRLGGAWLEGSASGSRCARWGNTPWDSLNLFGARFCANHLVLG